MKKNNIVFTLLLLLAVILSSCATNSPRGRSNNSKKELRAKSSNARTCNSRTNTKRNTNARCKTNRKSRTCTNAKQSTTTNSKISVAAGIGKNTKIIFLHHSTGQNVFNYGNVKDYLKKHNKKHKTNYSIVDRKYPASKPYGWKNYPYDYWNIWVNHAGNKKYKNEETLEILTKAYDVIIWKHCFPVSRLSNTGKGNIKSESKTLANYKLQYNALKKKMRDFPNNRFIVWTGAVMTKASLNESQAKTMKKFITWVKNEWDEPGDNIFIWDFYKLETNGGLYLAQSNAKSSRDAHPSEAFCKRVAPLFANRIVNVIEGRGDTGSITGK